MEDLRCDLVRPCSTCPFLHRQAGSIRGARAEEIADALFAGESFTCHKTVKYDEDDDGRCTVVHTCSTQHCAGAMIVLMKDGMPNQWMRWMERLHMFFPDRLDMDAPVFADLAEFIYEHEWAERRVHDRAVSLRQP